MVGLIGLLGGSFDPIHHGHLHLAVRLKEIHGLNEVWFIPSLQNPLKPRTETPFSHRSKMTELALQDLPYCKVLKFESEEKIPTYTIDVVKDLKKQFPDASFRLLLGDDHLSQLPQWRDINKLFELSPPLIGTRKREFHLDPSLRNLVEDGITPIPLLEISSTDIRERLKKNLYCGHLVPSQVLDYIKQNGLYCLPYGRF